MGRHNLEYDFKIAGVSLPSLKKIKDLGVIFDNYIKFGNHIETIVSKSRQRLGVLFRAYSCRELKFMRLAYTTYIRPLLEYNTQVWSPTGLGEINRIESVQRSFTRRIPQLKQFNYHVRLEKIGLETLELRRIKNDLIMYFKIIKGFVALSPADFFVFAPKNYSTRGNDFKISKPKISQNLYTNLFSCRGINPWNSLPNDAVNAPSIASFKNRINKIDFTNFLHGRA
jgi:hypothetical protein